MMQCWWLSMMQYSTQLWWLRMMQYLTQLWWLSMMQNLTWFWVLHHYRWLIIIDSSLKCFPHTLWYWKCAETREPDPWTNLKGPPSGRGLNIACVAALKVCFATQVAKLGEITAKTWVLYSELGEITMWVGTWTLSFQQILPNFRKDLDPITEKVSLCVFYFKWQNLVGKHSKQFQLPIHCLCHACTNSFRSFFKTVCMFVSMYSFKDVPGGMSHFLP